MTCDSSSNVFLTFSSNPFFTFFSPQLQTIIKGEHSVDSTHTKKDPQLQQKDNSLLSVRFIAVADPGVNISRTSWNFSKIGDLWETFWIRHYWGNTWRKSFLFVMARYVSCCGFHTYQFILYFRHLHILSLYHSSSRFKSSVPEVTT